MGNWGYNPYKWSYNPTYKWYGAHLVPYMDPKKISVYVSPGKKPR